MYVHNCIDRTHSGKTLTHFFSEKRWDTLRSRTPTLTGGECKINSLFKALTVFRIAERHERLSQQIQNQSPVSSCLMAFVFLLVIFGSIVTPSQWRLHCLGTNQTASQKFISDSHRYDKSEMFGAFWELFSHLCWCCSHYSSSSVSKWAPVSSKSF